MEHSSHREKGLINNLRPKSAFKAGLLSGLAVMFVIGFFVLLGIMLSDNKGGGGRATNTGNSGGTVAAGNSNPPPTPRPSAGNININPVDPDEDWIKGNKDAKISIVEFSDTECPFCKRFHGTMQQIVDEFDGDVNWVYRHFPLAQLHPKAAKEAEATECAGEQGGNDAFWAYTDRLMDITPSNNGLDVSQLPEIADFVGLNVDKFNECLDSGKFSKKVAEHVNQATAAGGRGTPYSVILAGDQKIPINGALPFDTIKSQLESLLN